ncbi:MAG: DUF3344 domain-containing protein, partial [Methanoregulaceae archaeon]
MAAADDFVGGIPLTTVQSGSVTGDLWFDIDPAPNWGSQNVVKTFTLPAAAVAQPGRIVWARLYISAYCGHMQEDKAFTITNRFDGDGDGRYEHVWPGAGRTPFNYLINGGNNNGGFSGHGGGEPYKMLSDHENRVTSDYFMWYDVTDLISSQTVNVNVDTTGSFDGRIKVISLVVAYHDPSSTMLTTYWVNQGHDVCTYYTEDNFGMAAVGSTSFDTTGLSDMDSAILTASYMASNNGYYGFPTASNDFRYTGGTPSIEGRFTNLELDRDPDVQGPYSGIDSWDVTSSVTGSGEVTFAYSRYFPATGTAAFFKIPLAFLVVKSQLAISPPEAAFSSDVTSGTAPLTVTFTDESTNAPTSWLWDFGDGGTSTGQYPVHEYMSAGTYTVTLTVTNGEGSDEAVRPDYITVNALTGAPEAAFSSDVTSGTVPLTVTFTDESTNAPTSWLWDFGDGGTSTGQYPVHEYMSAGTYTVTLTVTNGEGSDEA